MSETPAPLGKSTLPAPDDGRTGHLILAGLGNSGADHWQRAWATWLPRVHWLEHDSWNEPVESQWLADLDEWMADGTSPVVVVAHSLGCPLFALWATRAADDPQRREALKRVRAVMFVAPPDTARPDFPSSITGFSLAHLKPVPFPSVVVASTNDPYGAPASAQDFAERLGSRLEMVGALGHINSASRLGLWPQGQHILLDLVGRAPEPGGTRPA